jgi:energy-coupling factor transport system ATP-binding protein
MLLGIDLIRTEHLSAMVSASGPTALGWAQLGRYCLLIGLLLLTAMLVGPRKESRIRRTHRPFNRRTGIEILVLFGMIPLTIWLGLYYLDTKQYYLTALAILAEGMAAFFLAFEGRRPQARELVLVAAVCALNIAGRAAFFMIPQFKPVLAMTILSGVALGGETGFLVGAVTMLASNMLFSQGPWTPWQMAAMGLCGFLAAVFYRIGLLRRSRASLCVFGALCAILVYGGIMNPTSVFLWGSEAISWNLILSYYITGFPMDCIHAAATAFFLFLLGEPMLNQFDRIKRKYGWMEAETK